MSTRSCTRATARRPSRAGWPRSRRSTGDYWDLSVTEDGRVVHIVVGLPVAPGSSTSRPKAGSPLTAPRGDAAGVLDLGMVRTLTRTATPDIVTLTQQH